MQRLVVCMYFCILLHEFDTVLESVKVTSVSTSTTNFLLTYFIPLLLLNFLLLHFLPPLLLFFSLLLLCPSSSSSSFLPRSLLLLLFLFVLFLFPFLLLQPYISNAFSSHPIIIITITPPLPLFSHPPLR